MANPRELAEQAFALLQNALSESEARASNLDDQLKRRSAPKTSVEEQLDVLTHRLEGLEAERLRWQQQAGHLEEIAEGERVKVAQLKKKLEIAESGPEKLTKKEVNFWRAKAETIDAQIREYQERLAALRRELNERDALIQKLEAAGGQSAPEPAAPPPDAEAELRRQLELRDEWLTELRLELHELRGQPAPPLETQAEVETLRGQITSLERSLAESRNSFTAAQAELALAEHELAAREQAVREAAGANERAAREAAAGERARTTLAEREHRIAELAAEVEHLRNDLRRREETERTHTARYEEQIAALTRDAEALRSRIEQDRHDTSAARAALEIAVHEREQETDRQRQLLAANERDAEKLRQEVAERERAAAEAGQQLEQQRAETFERERELADRQEQVRELGRMLAERERELAAAQEQQRELSEALAARDRRLAESAGELDDIRAAVAARGRETDSLRETLQYAQRELEHARATLTANEAERENLRETLDARTRELDELRAEKQRLETALAAAEVGAASAAADVEAAREQIAGLETELKEEREHAESLGELANERREHMTKLQEQVEEAEERYADASWRLGKSLYFERIVKRRKGLILKLLEAVRAKMKANVALKAGIDGLRTFKQTAEMNQHQLLQRIDGLTADLKEAEETIKRHQGATATKEELANAVARAATFEGRLNTQAELIESLESDLKKARLAAKPGQEHLDDLARVMKELGSKNEIIARLQADVDELQRKLAKLRGSDSESARLKAMTEKDRSEIDALQREIARLREMLAQQNDTAVAAAANRNAELEAKLKALTGTIKEHEATIKKLTESAESWKRKYQFLATDQPDAYKHPVQK